MAHLCVVVTLAVCCLVNGASGTDPGPAYADWLNSACRADSDCPAARNSMCFEGLCLCTPGYYYSVGQKTCVKECAEGDLQKTFLKYPGSSINGYTADYRKEDDEGSCLEWCGSVTECLAVEYRYDVCILQSRAVLEVPVSDWFTGNNGHNHYQKMCA